MPSKFDTNQWIRSWSDKKQMTPLPERSKPKESASDSNKQNRFTRAMMTSMIAENPSVAAANGYRIKPNGDIVQEDTPESRQLAKNLAVLGGATSGAMAIGSGAAATGLKTAWNVVNNPFVSAGIDVATGNYGDAAVGLAIDFTPLRKIAKSFGLFDKTKGRWDVDKMLKLIKGAKEDAVKYLDNEYVTKAGLENMAIAKRLGLDIMPTFGSKHAKHPIQFEAEGLDDFENGNIGLALRPEKMVH